MKRILEKIRQSKKGTIGLFLIIATVVGFVLSGTGMKTVSAASGLVNREIGTDYKSTTSRLSYMDKYNKRIIKIEVQLLINKYNAGKKDGDNSNLANFLRKELQVGVAENEDKTYSFKLGEWKIVVNETKVESVEKFKLDVDKTYPSVADMRKDTALKAGNLVKTEGYWDKEHGGGAYYDIISATSYILADNPRYIELENGLYAELHAINDTVTVNQFGAYGDGKTDDASAIWKAFNSSYSNILLESESYYIAHRIDINSGNRTIIGNNATIFLDNEFDFWRDDFIIGIYNNKEDVNDISIQNLSLINNNTSYEPEYLMFKLMGVQNIEFYQCNVETNYAEDGKDRRVTNIDMRNHWENVTIDGCNLINTTCGPAGGSVWARSGKKASGNLVIKNTYIKKSCHDETIAIFGAGRYGTVTNVTISNNIIDVDDTNVESPSWPVINFGGGAEKVSDITLKNNEIKIKAVGGFIVAENAKTVKILNNDIDITSILKWQTSYFGAANSTGVEFRENTISLTHEKDNEKDHESDKKEVEGFPDEIFDNIDTIVGNTIKLNTNLIFLFRNASDVSENTIHFEKKLTEQYSSIFVIKFKSLNKDVKFNKNILDFSVVELEDNLQVRLINLWGSALNGCKFDVSGNKVTGQKGQGSNQKYCIYLQEMWDSLPKDIHIYDNTFGFFLHKGADNNTTTYNIVEDEK